MKKMFAALLLLSLFGCASMQPVSQQDLSIEKVVEVPDLNKDQIYDQTKIWIAENFRSAKAVLEYENKETGTIIGNGTMSYPCSGLGCLAKADWKTHFTMRVDIKDSKYRATFSNLRLWTPATTSPIYMPAAESPIHWQEDLDAIKPKLLDIVDQMTASLKNSKNKANW